LIIHFTGDVKERLKNLARKLDNAAADATGKALKQFLPEDMRKTTLRTDQVVNLQKKCRVLSVTYTIAVKNLGRDRHKGDKTWRECCLMTVDYLGEHSPEIETIGMILNLKNMELTNKSGICIAST
jgi:hypothetical protein